MVVYKGTLIVKLIKEDAVKDYVTRELELTKEHSDGRVRCCLKLLHSLGGFSKAALSVFPM